MEAEELVNPFPDLIAQMMGQAGIRFGAAVNDGGVIGVMVNNGGENGDDDVQIIEGGPRRNRRRRNRAGNQGDIGDPGDIRDFMAQQMLNQMMEMIMRTGNPNASGNPNSGGFNFGDYVVGQGGLDDIITR
jgi:hypothetical protein